MKTLLALLAFAVTAYGQAPAPIAATDVPDNVTMATPAAVKAGVAVAYNKAVLDAFNAHTSREAAKPVGDRVAFVAPTPLAYLRARIGDVYRSYAQQASTEDLSGTRIEHKWELLTPAQRAAIKTTLSSATE